MTMDQRAMKNEERSILSRDTDSHCIRTIRGKVRLLSMVDYAQKEAER